MVIQPGAAHLPAHSGRVPLPGQDSAGPLFRAQGGA